MVPEDVYALTGVADPRLHPDGRHVAYVRSWIDRDENEYRSAIWVAAVDGSEPARRLTAGERGDSSPRWAPDGTRLAFTSSRGGKEEKAQVYVLPFAGGEALKLTELDEDASELTWSPDGTRIAFSSRVRDDAYEEEDEKKRRPRRFARLRYKLDNVGWTGDRRQHVFTVPADGSEQPTQLTDGDFEDSSPAWSPDGRRIAFVSARDDDWDVKLEDDIYVIDAGGGEPERVTNAHGNWEALVWSPDGAQIAGLFSPDAFDWPRHGQVAVVAADGGDPRILTGTLDRNCSPYPSLRPPAWEDGRIVFAAEDGGNVHVYGVRADGSATPELVIGGEQVVTGFDLAGETVVHSASQATALSELWAGDQQLTRVGHAFAEHRELGVPERFTAVSEDGSAVDAWILRPAGFREGTRYPALLSIHGGPFSQYHTGFFDEFQIYAGAGYAVVWSNPRGSSGYNEEWGRAIRGPSNGQGPGWGTRDYDDLTAVVDTALERFDVVDRTLELPPPFLRRVLAVEPARVDDPLRRGDSRLGKDPSGLSLVHRALSSSPDLSRPFPDGNRMHENGRYVKLGSAAPRARPLPPGPPRPLLVS